jgi:transglutaminase-like putative cysteine protease
MEPMRFPRAILVFLAASWALVVLYPDPAVLGRSVRNVLRPQIQPEAVAALAARLPDDPAAVEREVLDRVVPYSYDWRTWGVPWYFPTPAEVLRAGRGDCESRAVVLASILTAKGIPNELRVGLGHIWVDYPGKRPSALENAAVEVAGRRDGRFFVRWPERLDVREELADQVAMHWTPAPPARVAALFTGLLWIALWNPAAALLAGSRGRASHPFRRKSVRRRRGLAAHPRQV